MLSGSIRVRVTGQGGSFPLERSTAPAPAPLRRSLPSLHRLLSTFFTSSICLPSALPLPLSPYPLTPSQQGGPQYKIGFHFIAHLVFLSTLRCLSGISHLSLFILFPTNKELLFSQNNGITGHRGQEDHVRSVSGTGTEHKNPDLHGLFLSHESFSLFLASPRPPISSLLSGWNLCKNSCEEERPVTFT